MKKEYTGSVYLAVTEGDQQYGVCRDSIDKILLRPGDEGPTFARGTKGFASRQAHLNNWYEHTKHDFILFLDGDQIFPQNTAERLRFHKLPFVSGYYMRRDYDPILPVWFEPFTGFFPYLVVVDPVAPDTLYELGASGWGCMLLHREVIDAVRPILKGEPEIIEDDMDVWPYDLRQIMGAIGGLRKLCESKPDTVNLYPALGAHVDTLEREIRPLRVDKKTIIGSDIRFPFYARQAGYKLFGDSGVSCGHMVNYPVSLENWTQTPDETRANLKKIRDRNTAKERRQLKEAKAALHA